MHRLHRHTYRANGGGEAQVASVFQVETPERAKHEKRMRRKVGTPVRGALPDEKSSSKQTYDAGAERRRPVIARRTHCTTTEFSTIARVEG